MLCSSISVPGWACFSTILGQSFFKILIETCGYETMLCAISKENALSKWERGQILIEAGVERVRSTSTWSSMQCTFDREVWKWVVCLQIRATTFNSYLIRGFIQAQTWHRKFRICRSRNLYSTRIIQLVCQKGAHLFVLHWKQFWWWSSFLAKLVC